MKSRKLIVMIAMIMMLVTPVFAAQVAVTWEWLLSDPDVKYFRYQLGGEDPTGWTVVTSDVTYYEKTDLDGSQAYTLYLQQSYDGLYWSGSASATSEPIIPVLPEIEEPVVAEEAVVAEPAAEVPAEEAVTAPEPVYGSVSVYGYPISWKFVPGQLEVTYPSFVTDAEAIDFIAFTYGRNARFLDGVFYELLGNGKAVITIPEGASYEDVEYVGTAVIGDLFDYVNILFAPAPAEEAPAQPAPSKEIPVVTLPEDVELPAEAVTAAPAPVVEEAPAPVAEEPAPAPVEEVVLPVAEVTVEPVAVPAVKEKAPYRFVLSLGGGAGIRTADFSSKLNTITLTTGLGFENIVSFGKSAGLTLQINLGADLGLLMPYGDLFANPSNIISLSSYAKKLYAEPMLALTFGSGSVTAHVGAGARFILGGANADNLANWKLPFFNSKQVGLMIAPSANAGVRFNFGKTFGIGLDVNYAYLMNKVSAKQHDVSGRVSMAFTF